MVNWPLSISWTYKVELHTLACDFNESWMSNYTLDNSLLLHNTHNTKFLILASPCLGYSLKQINFILIHFLSFGTSINWSIAPCWSTAPCLTSDIDFSFKHFFNQFNDSNCSLFLHRVLLQTLNCNHTSLQTMALITFQTSTSHSILED